MKELYKAPSAETLALKNEGIICTSGFGNPGAPGKKPGIIDYSDDF